MNCFQLACNQFALNGMYTCGGRQREKRDIEGGVHCREGREKGKEGKGGGWYFTTCLMSKRTCKILQLTVECCPEQGGPYTITQQSEGVKVVFKMQGKLNVW